MGNMSKIVNDVTAEFKARYSPHTFRKYRPIVVDFITWSVQVKKVDTREELCVLGVKDVEAYLQKYPVEASASTRNSAISAIAALYSTVLGCSKDLTSLRARVKADGIPEIILSEEEAEAVIDNLQYPFKIMAHLIYHNGLTVKEIFELRLTEQGPATSKDLLTADGWVEPRLTIWIEDQRLRVGEKLFRVDEKWFRNRVERAGRKAGLRYIAPMVLRYSGAGRILQAGATVAELQEWLGCSRRTAYSYNQRLSPGRFSQVKSPVDQRFQP
jgi:site-specific recombinase XerD